MLGGYVRRVRYGGVKVSICRGAERRVDMRRKVMRLWKVGGWVGREGWMRRRGELGTGAGLLSVVSE